MSAVYFVNVGEKHLHDSIIKAARTFDLSNLLSFTLYEPKQTTNSESTKTKYSKEILSSVLIFADPVFATKKHISLSESRPYIENKVKRMPGVKVNYGITVCEAFGNVKGLNGFLPLIKKFGASKRHNMISLYSKVLEKILEIIADYAEIDVQRTALFFGADNNGIIILSYLLEKLAEKMDFTERILAPLTRLMTLIRKNHQQFYGKYLELVIYNPDTWLHASDTVFTNVISSIQGNAMNTDSTPEMKADYLRILLNFIESYSAQEPLPETRLDRLKETIYMTYSENITSNTIPKLFSILFSYSNGYSLKDKKSQFIQIYYVLSIFFKLFSTCKNLCKYSKGRK